MMMRLKTSSWESQSYGLHDLRPLSGQELFPHNVTGWFWGGVGGESGEGARVEGGVVEFVGAPRAWWAANTCSV